MPTPAELASARLTAREPYGVTASAELTAKGNAGTYASANLPAIPAGSARLATLTPSYAEYASANFPYGAVPAFDDAAIFAVDAPTNRYRFSGVSYATEAAAVAAAGGSDVSGTLKIGPYEIGTSTVSNGDFAANVTGWTAQNSGLVAWSAGQLQLTGNGGNNAGASQVQAVTAYKVYRLSATVTRVTGGSAPYLALSGAAGLGGAFVQTLLAGFDTPTALSVVWGAIQTSAYVGIKMNSAAAAGTNLLDNVVMKEVVPFAGLTGGVTSFEHEFVVPTAGAGNQVQLCMDDDSERNSIKVYTDASSHLIVSGMLNSISQFSTDLGAVTPGAVAKFTGSFQTGFNFMQLDSQAVVRNTNFVLGGGILRIGRDFTGNAAPAGSRRKVQVFTERMPADYIQLDGDSYVGESADGTSLTRSIQNVSARRTFATGLGSSTLTQARDRVVAHPGFYRNPLIILDGVPNGYGTLVADRAKYQAMVDTRTHGRFLIIPPITTPSSASDVNAAAVALQADIAATWPNNFISLQAFVDATPDAYQADNAHLKAAVMDAFALTVVAWLAARSW